MHSHVIHIYEHTNSFTITMCLLILYVIIIELELAECKTIYVQNVSVSDNTINVTGSRCTNRVDGTFFDDNVTWFDAANQCKLRGFGEFETSGHNWQRWHVVLQMLRELNYRHPFHVWVGVFRMISPNNTFYIGNSTCKVPRYTNHILNVENTTYECVAAFISDFYTHPVYMVENCVSEYPYICNTKYNPLPMYEYTGFQIDDTISGFVPSGLNKVTSDSHSKSNCTDQCNTQNGCLSFEFDPINNTCYTFYATAGYGHATYSLVRSATNNSHGVLHGCNYIMNTSVVSVNEKLQPLQYAFSSCSFDSIPSGYCLNNGSVYNISSQTCSHNNCSLTSNTSDIDVVYEIPKRSTSQTKRRHECADDDRLSSKISGILAVIIMFLPVCLMMCSDVQRIVEAKKSKNKRA